MEDQAVTKIMIERLHKEVSEAEIRMTISTSNLPRPEKIVLEKHISSVTAVLHFYFEMEAYEFESKTKGKFLSSRGNVTFIPRQPHPASPVYVAPYDPGEDIEMNILTDSEDDPIKESPVYEAPYDPGEDIKMNIQTDSEDDPIKESPVYEAPNDKGRIFDDSGGYLRADGDVPFSPNNLQTNLSFLKILSPPSNPLENGKEVMEMVKNSPPSDIKVEEDSGPKPTEVVLVNIYFGEESQISQIKVYLVNVRKHQNFYGRPPDILVGALLRYIKKNHEVPTSETKMLLVTPCVYSYGAFCQTLCGEEKNRKMFHSYFSHWLDLQSLNNNYHVRQHKLKMIKGVQFSDNKVSKMLKRMLNKEIKNFSSVYLMKTILNINPLVANRELETFSPEKLLRFSQQCPIKRRKYLVVGLHLGLAELIMAGTEEVTLSPATLCFRDNIRGSWFVGINQPPNINRKSANKLGFIQKGDLWTYGEASQSCLNKREALECFLRGLQEELEQGRFSQLILLTCSNDETLPVLLSSLSTHCLLDDFNRMVAGVGSLEDVARAVSPELELRTLEDFSNYYELVLRNKRPDLSKPQSVPRLILHVLDSLLGGEAGYDNCFSQLCHPLISPYTNSLLLQSRLPQVKEDFWDIRAAEATVVKAETNKTIRAVVDVDRISVLGKHIYIQTLSDLQFVEKKVRLGKKKCLEFMVFNTRSSDVTISRHEIIGISHISDSFHFPASEFKSVVPQASEMGPLASSSVSPETITSKSSPDVTRPQSTPKNRCPLPSHWLSSSSAASDVEIAHQNVVPHHQNNQNRTSDYAPPEEIHKVKNISEIFENQPRRRFIQSAVKGLDSRGKMDLHDPIESSDKIEISPSSVLKQKRDPRQIRVNKKLSELISKVDARVGKKSYNNTFGTTSADISLPSVSAPVTETPSKNETLSKPSASETFSRSRALQTSSETRILPGPDCSSSKIHSRQVLPPSFSARHETRDDGQILVIEDLPADISEAEILMKISLDKLPKADTVIVKNGSTSATATVQFSLSAQAETFRRSLNGRFLSDRRNIFLGRHSDLEKNKTEKSGRRKEGDCEGEALERQKRKRDVRKTSSPDCRKSPMEVTFDPPKKKKKSTDTGDIKGPNNLSPRPGSSAGSQRVKEFQDFIQSSKIEIPECDLTEQQPDETPDSPSPQIIEENDDTATNRIREIQKIIDESKKFKKDFIDLITHSRLASKEQDIPPPSNPKKKVRIKSEKWIEKREDSSRNVVVSVSGDESRNNVKHSETVNGAEIVKHSNYDHSNDVTGTDDFVDDSITIEEFKIENALDEYNNKDLTDQMEEQKYRPVIKLTKISLENYNNECNFSPPPVKPTTPPLKKRKRSVSSKKIVAFSTQKKPRNSDRVRAKVTVKVTQVNLDQVEDILDIVNFTCDICNKVFLSLPGLKSHTTKMHRESSVDESFAMNEISNYIVDTEPLVPQVKILSENLQRLTLTEENLTVQFSILLSFPQFINLIKTFIRFYQKPVNKIQKDLKDFAECLLSKLMESEVYSLDSLQKEIVKMHKKKRTASLRQWRQMVTARWKSFKKIQTGSDEFYLNDAVLILILYCSHSLE